MEEKLSPELKILLAAHLSVEELTSQVLSSLQVEKDLSALEEASEEAAKSQGDEPNLVTVHVSFQDDLSPLVAVGFVPITQAGDVVIGEIEILKLPALASLPNVLLVEQPERPHLKLDYSIPDIKADKVWSRREGDFKGLSGDGIVIGVIDTGIDYIHKTFRNADGTTRILNIWDQTLTPNGVNEISPAAISHPILGPAAFGYGVEYTNDASGNAPTINKALNSDKPRSIVRHQDNDGHGTHVASIAAGNGAQNGNCYGKYHYIGVAPKASLIIVRLQGMTKGDPPQRQNAFIDAIRYIAERAAGKACVINLSLGSSLGSRAGFHSDQKMVDNILSSYSKGFAIIVAAGNEGNKDIHAQVNIPSGKVRALKINVPANINEKFKLGIYYSGTNLSIAIKPPNNLNVEHFKHRAEVLALVKKGGGSVDISYSANRILLIFKPPVSMKPSTRNNITPGEWTLYLKDTANKVTSLYAWLSTKKVKFTTFVSKSSTISPDASSDNVIVVGAHSSEQLLPGVIVPGELAALSSRGPSLKYPDKDIRNIRPHITAPGVAVTAAAIEKDQDTACCCDCCQIFYNSKTGTSMATPHVTGAVALMLAKNSTLSFSDIRDKLKRSARTDVQGVSFPNNDWGWGKLNVKAAIDEVKRVASPPPSPKPSPVIGPIPVVALSSNPSPIFSLRERLRSTPEGEHYYQLFYSHFHEVRNLINQNKRVAVIWHRNGGSSLISLAMRAASQPEESLPLEVEGMSLYDCLRAVSSLLQKYGSVELSRDIDIVLPLLEILQEGLRPYQIVDRITQSPKIRTTSVSYSLSS